MLSLECTVVPAHTAGWAPVPHGVSSEAYGGVGWLCVWAERAFPVCVRVGYLFIFGATRPNQSVGIFYEAHELQPLQ